MGLNSQLLLFRIEHLELFIPFLQDLLKLNLIKN